MAFEAKAEILAAIGKTEDPNMKVVLLLLLAVFEEIGDKIDDMRADEKGLREAVLNGHAPELFWCWSVFSGKFPLMVL